MAWKADAKYAYVIPMKKLCVTKSALATSNFIGNVHSKMTAAFKLRNREPLLDRQVIHLEEELSDIYNKLRVSSQLETKNSF
jgi:hypothetical protein